MEALLVTMILPVFLCEREAYLEVTLASSLYNNHDVSLTLTSGQIL